MNTRKQILVMTALIMLSMVFLGGYAQWMPTREKASVVELEDKAANRGSILFARNCRLCHGDVGEGGKLGSRLPAAPTLDRPDLQGFVDVDAILTAAVKASDTSIRVTSTAKFKAGQFLLVDSERMVVKGVDGFTLNVERANSRSEAADHNISASVLVLDADTLKDKVKLITNTLTCGRVGSAMPPWAQSQGGPLSDEQIRQLMIVITTSRWDLVKEEVDVEDLLKSSLLEDVTEDTISFHVSDRSVFSEKDAFRIGDERLRVTAVAKIKTGEKDKSGIIQVDRGVLGTTPLPHTTDERIYKFPETAEPSINAASCGQTAKPVVAAEPKLVEPFDGQKVAVTASGIKFNVPTISVKTGGKVRIRLDNQDKDTQHNIAIYKSKSDLKEVAPGSIGTTFTGVNQNDSVFDVPAPGTYYFRCDVHPDNMSGSFVVTP